MEQQITSPKSTSTRRSPAVETHQQPAVNWSRRHPFVQVRDVDGGLWDVHEARATKHGFDLLFGRPANSHLDGPPPNARLIATSELIAFWETHRYELNFVNNLPASTAALWRVRRTHGFNFYRDRRALWQERVSGCEDLTIRELAERHNVAREVAADWRMRLLGRTARPLDWWHAPAVLELLRGPLRLRELANQLALDPSWASRLRKEALASSDDDLAKRAAARPKRAGRPKSTRWQTAEVVTILRSPVTARAAALKLGISASHAMRLRHALASNNQLIAA